MLPPRLVVAIIVTVMVAFVITFSAQFVIAGYKPETAIYGMFGAVAAAALSGRRKEDKK